jgi:signal transduction histidine kinase
MTAMPYQPSIRQKITLGYYAIAVIIVCLTVFAFVELRFLERKVLFGEEISAFFDTALEIRRFEKNYMLYRQQADLDENLQYVVKAQALIESNLKDFGRIVAPERIEAVARDLKRYRALMAAYASADSGNAARQAELEREIRNIGKHITTVAEHIARTERRMLQTSLNRSISTVLFSIVVLSLFGIVIGRVLSRMVVRPLKLLEESMETLGKGRPKRIEINSRDREIVSLTRAFNTMLAALELGQKHLIQSEKLAALGTLLSGVAHELNNPLSNISSSCQILLEELEDGDIEYRRELLLQIDEQTVRAQNIVRSLLEFSRHREFRKEPVPLKDLLMETLRFVRGQVPSGVSIDIDIPSDLVIPADKQRLQQALLNLIKNGLEAMGEAGELSIRARKHIGQGDEHRDMASYLKLKYRGNCPLGEAAVDIEVKDTGPGIPADLQTKIFDPFFTTKDVGKGSGLGLFIVHEIIEEHDGCIAVDSEPSRGTAFLIRLPLGADRTVTSAV